MQEQSTEVQGLIDCALRCALILNGVDTCNSHGWVSAVHSDEDIERTVNAFEKALSLMQEDGFFAP